MKSKGMIQSLTAVVILLSGSQSFSAPSTLFTTKAPGSQWTQFKAAGFSKPVTGVIYRLEHPTTNGLALGAIDTGCIDLETSGLWGYSTIFNTNVPRRGPMNLPFLGVSIGDKTWVLCDPKQIKQGQGNFQPPVCMTIPAHKNYLESMGLPIGEPYLDKLDLSGVQTAKEIHYWGHYPVADLEYETDSPVSVGLRAWTPFLPGDVKNSMIPGIVFEVHIRNTDSVAQKGTVAFSFPGPTALEGGSTTFSRNERMNGFAGVEVAAPNASYVLGVIGKDRTRFGGELGASGAAWATIESSLPSATVEQPGSSAAVDFNLKPGGEKVVRFVLTWYSPTWKGGGKSWATQGNTFTHMYAKYYPSAVDTAAMFAKNHASLLRRTLAWQQVLYTDKNTPGWLADSMINSLYMITETGMWAQKKDPIPSWVREEDGIWGMNECPRTCPQIECIPCGFYGNQPLVYMFPELALSTLRAYKGYMFPDGAAPWIFGGWTGGTPPVDFAMPGKGYQFTTNGISMAAMIDRYLLCHPDQQKELTKEFYTAVKKNLIYTINLTPDDLPIGDRILSMPTVDRSEWFEAQEWFGVVSHVGGLHIAQLQIGRRLAELVGDTAFVKQCDDWIKAGSDSLESKLWANGYYLNCFDPITKRKDDLMFGFQLDGEWITDNHGLPGVFQTDRIKTTLDTIKRCNTSISISGVVNYAHADGSPAPVGGYGTYSYFPPEVLMVAMNYMYEGQNDYGMELAKRCWENLICKQGYTWDMPNVMRGDVDTGERDSMRGGHDYYQDMMIWSLPAAMAGHSVDAPIAPGGLVNRVLRAAKGK